MSAAHLLYGFAGAGKTTFAIHLENSLDQVIRFTHDEWMHRLFGADPPIESFAQMCKNIDSLIWELTLKQLALGNDVILDYGFWSRKQRDTARSRVASAGANYLLYWIQCPTDLMRARVHDRSDAVPENSLYIDDPAFDVLFARFEELGDDEEFIAIDGTVDEYHFSY